MRQLLLPILTISALEQQNTVIDYSDICPTFTCDTIHNGGIDMNEQVFCYRTEVDNPFKVKLKTCQNGQFCHAQLNRCAMDPYFQIHDRLPGSTCTQHYECKSKHCSMEEGVCKVEPYKGELLSTCESHSDCNAGKYCAD